MSQPAHRAATALILTAVSAAPSRAVDLFDFSQHSLSFAIEAGPQFTPALNISGAHQGSATTGWHNVNADVRLEAWYTRPGALNLGLVLQPIFNTYSGNLSSNLTVNGQTFPKGAPATLDFQFPFARVTANYPVWSAPEGEVRLGASIIARYAYEKLQSGPTRATFSNFLALPLLNIDAHATLSGRWSAVARADLLPAENGTGIYDAFIGVRYDLESPGRAVELGARTFYGGYTPNTSNQINTRVLLESVALRLVF